MTSFGILMPAIRPPDTVKEGDECTLQIRARRAKDLDILRARYMPGTLGETIHTPKFDYEFRAYCRPQDFAEAMYLMVMEINYKKFKPTTESIYKDRELHTCYNSIWSVVMDKLSTKTHQSEYWHSTRPYSGKGGKHASGKASVSYYGANGFVGSGLGYGDDEPRTHTLPMYSGGTTSHRNTSADRDEYTSEVWDDLDWDSLPKAAASLDRLYDELTAVESAIKDPTDHEKCSHPDTRNAKSRCRARRRRSEQARVAEIKKMIDEIYEDDSLWPSIEDIANVPLEGEVVPASEPKAITGGYPWEKKSQPQLIGNYPD